MSHAFLGVPSFDEILYFCRGVCVFFFLFFQKPVSLSFHRMCYTYMICMRRIGRRLKEVFGRKVAFGLEGGYNLQARNRIHTGWRHSFPSTDIRQDLRQDLRQGSHQRTRQNNRRGNLTLKYVPGSALFVPGEGEPPWNSHTKVTGSKWYTSFFLYGFWLRGILPPWDTLVPLHHQHVSTHALRYE